jgi:PAS domain S-box-containing protein
MEEVLGIKAVNDFRELDLIADKELEEAVNLATKIFKTPIAVISLVNEDMLVVKASVGFCLPTYSRSSSICNYTIEQRKLIVVPDTTLDQRLKTFRASEIDNDIRFYAGAPLITSCGLCIGTLCVMDYVSKDTSAQDELTLSILAKHVISIMEAKLNLSKFNQSFIELEKERERAISNEIKLRALFESLTDVYVFLGLNGEILDFNQAAYNRILEDKGKKMTRGSYTSDFLNEVDNAAFMNNFYSALTGKRKQQEMQTYAELGKRTWWDSIFEPVRNIDGEMMGVSYIARDINKRKIDSEKILKQNRILKKIAHFHSHEYRGPVCAILGIMDLIEGEDFAASRESLLMLQRAVKSLDDKTHSVINLISELELVSDRQP